MVNQVNKLVCFRRHTISSVVQCAGNRRAGLNAAKEVRLGGPHLSLLIPLPLLPQVKGLMWQSTAIGNAEWTGVRLADVLRDAGVDETAAHVWMTGLDQDPLQVRRRMKSTLSNTTLTTQSTTTTASLEGFVSPTAPRAID